MKGLNFERFCSKAENLSAESEKATEMTLDRHWRKVIYTIAAAFIAAAISTNVHAADKKGRVYIVPYNFYVDLGDRIARLEWAIEIPEGAKTAEARFYGGYREIWTVDWSVASPSHFPILRHPDGRQVSWERDDRELIQRRQREW